MNQFEFDQKERERERERERGGCKVLYTPHKKWRIRQAREIVRTEDDVKTEKNMP